MLRGTLWFWMFGGEPWFRIRVGNGISRPLNLKGWLFTVTSISAVILLSLVFPEPYNHFVFMGGLGVVFGLMYLKSGVP
ncbi:hypothetical protein AAC691_05465 [Nguyenibacter vanlangensis]|uniref:Uncharacterized protein n=1 Tax=Nguyenibacter vanlangensis TaxID=1216886 RepID=A0A7Y7M8H3_9PROT|nr:hypothetical protein [Nguyenibacter vanlangensis]NVN12263.1 hypothetical protein [Nguyenibacter vanlangensis]